MGKSRKKSGIRTGVKGILLGLTIVLTLSLLISYAAPFISPERLTFPAFFGLAYPILLVANLLVFITWLLLWKKYLWIPLLAIATGYDQVLTILQVRTREEPVVQEDAIRVMTFNIHSLYGIQAGKKEQKIRSRVTDFIGKEHPDILCIQEFAVNSSDTAGVPGRISEAIGLEYFFYKNYFDLKKPGKINALAIFSKYPIVSVGSFRLNGKNIFAIYSDLIVREDTIRIYNLHLESNRFGTDDYTFYSQLKDAGAEKQPFTMGSKRILAKLNRAFPIRARQVDIAGKSVRESPYPVVACGDFNDTPTSYTYHVMTTELKDAFREAGQGLFGSTFAGNFPSFRIDYILAGDDFEFLGYRRHTNVLSDHYPVSATLRIIR